MLGLIDRAELLTQLADARHEGGCLLLVGGEAGVGKTSIQAFTSGLKGRVPHEACAQSRPAGNPGASLVFAARENVADGPRELSDELMSA